jgi:hypothetical protein
MSFSAACEVMPRYKAKVWLQFNEFFRDLNSAFLARPLRSLVLLTHSISIFALKPGWISRPSLLHLLPRL